MTLAYNVATTLLECLREAIHAAAGDLPDERICLRAGEVFNPDRSRTEDECCPGVAWVRIAGSVRADQYDTGRPANCPNHLRTTTFELGIARCMPTPGPDALISCAQWTAVAEQMEVDHSSMEAAVCCLASMTDTIPGDPDIQVTEYVPRGPDANCVGGTLAIEVTHGCACGTSGS